MEELFVEGNENNLTAELLQSLFVPKLILLEGSNQRLKEEILERHTNGHRRYI